MNVEETKLAVKAVQTAWRREPMEDMEARQFARMFLDYPTEIVRAVIDTLIAQGSTRPGPAELASMIRTKMGKPTPGRRVQHHGPYLDEVEAPPDDFSDRMENLRWLAKR